MISYTRRLITLVVFALVCILAPPLHAQPSGIDLSKYQQVRYVSISTGSDETGDGSQTSPWRNLSHALTQITDAAQSKTYALLIASGI